MESVYLLQRLDFTKMLFIQECCLTYQYLGNFINTVLSADPLKFQTLPSVSHHSKDS